jgi:hypothetical protein
VDLAIQRTKESVEITVLRRKETSMLCQQNNFLQFAKAGRGYFFRPLIFPPAFHSSARLHDAIHSHDQLLRRSRLRDKGVSP